MAERLVTEVPNWVSSSQKIAGHQVKGSVLSVEVASDLRC